MRRDVIKKRLVCCLSGALLLSAVPAFAQVEGGTATITPFLGGYTFEGDQHLETRPAFGLRAGYNFTKRFGTEAVFDYVRTDGTRTDNDTNLYHYHLDLLYHMLPESRLVPFIMGGVGGVTIDSDILDKTAVAYNYGLGLKYALTDTIQFRGEARHLIYRHSGGTYNNAEYGLGLGFILGAAKKAVEPVAPPKPAAPEAAPAGKPTASLTIAPKQIAPGNSATMDWQCDNADTANIQPGIGGVAVRGSKAVTDPGEYVLTCSGAGGKSTATARLAAAPQQAVTPQPVCTITATPDTITEGESARVDWECTNTSAATLEPGVGKVEPKGSRTVTPAGTTIYTVTSFGGVASATSNATINVTPRRAEKRTENLEVHFDFDKAVVKKSYQDQLARVAGFLKEYPAVTGTLEGHTDSVGSHDYNMALSQRRADSVRKYLVEKYGIDGSRLKTVGYGPDKPAAGNDTAKGRAKNRRTVGTFEAEIPGKK